MSKYVLFGKDHEQQLLYPKLYGNLYRISLPFTYLLQTCDADTLKRMLTDTTSFKRGDQLVGVAQGLLESALFILASGETHKRHRKLLQPAFSPNHLRQVSKATVEVVDNLSELWKGEIAKNGSVEVNMDSMMQHATLDVLGIISFGRTFNAVSNEKVRKESVWSNLTENLFVPIERRFVIPGFLWRLCGISAQSPEILKTMKDMRSFFDVMIAESKDNVKHFIEKQDEKFELNVMERLLVSFEKGEMTEDEVFYEMLGFFIAGHETSSHSLVHIRLILDILYHGDRSEPFGPTSTLRRN